jgi:hypothetical protein
MKSPRADSADAVISRAKKSLSEELNRNDVHSLRLLQSFASSYVLSDVARCLAEVIKKHSKAFFPEKFPLGEFELSVSLFPDDTFRVTFERKTSYFHETLINPVVFPDGLSSESSTYPYEVTFDIRDDFQPDTSFLYAVFCELITTAQQWLYGCLYALLGDNVLKDIFAFLRNQHSNNTDILDDLFFVPVFDGYGRYVFSRSTAKNAFRKIASSFGNIHSVIYTAEMGLISIPLDRAFVRLALNESGTKEKMDLITAASGYKKQYSLYFNAEHVVLGRFFDMRLICKADDDTFLVAVYPHVRKDIAALLQQVEPALKKSFLNLVSSSRAKARIIDFSRCRDEKSNLFSLSSNESPIHIPVSLRNRGEGTSHTIMPPRGHSTPKEITDETSFLTNLIKKLLPSVFYNEQLIFSQLLVYIKDSDNNDTVKSRHFSLASFLYSFFLRMPQELGKAKDYLERHENDLIEEIKRILAEGHIDVSSQESENELISRIRQAISDSYKSLIHMVTSNDSLPKGGSLGSLAIERIPLSGIPYEIIEALKAWPEGREKTKGIDGKRRKQNSEQYVESIFDKYYKDEGGYDPDKHPRLRPADLLSSETNPNLYQALYRLHSRRGTTSRCLLWKTDEVTENIEMADKKGYGNLSYRDATRIRKAKYRRNKPSSSSSDS